MKPAPATFSIMRHQILHILCLCAILLTSCNGKKAARNEVAADAAPDTLRVATLYGPTSYFNYRGQKMGFDYENVKRFADEEGMVLDLHVAPSLQALLEMMEKGEAQLAAYPIPLIEEYKGSLRHCGHREVTWQVLVQPAGKHLLTDVTELVGKSIYVEKDSKYHYRLKNLNQELGGGIDIVPISLDSLITEDLLEMVENGEIPMTVIDSDIAELNKSYYPRLDTGMKISLEQYSSWAVGKNCDSLAARIDRWEKRGDNSEALRTVYKKYFEMSKLPLPYEDPASAFGLKARKDGGISPFDEIFKRHSAIPGYDWRLLAAIGFNESRFDNNVESWAGAKGLMQIMPSTAEEMGVRIETLRNPEKNILAAARLLKKLDNDFKEKIPDDDERLRFVVASYNSGQGHIYDAMALAEKYGLNPNVWFGNVSEAALMKSRPQFYNDPVVKNGYFRGCETTEFVERVMSVYDYFRQHYK